MRAAQYIAGPPENISIGIVDLPKLRPKEVLIKVIASAINRADTLQRQGKYEPPPGESTILGLEAAGFVHQLSPECSTKWKIGDRVMALLSGGGNAEYVASHEDHLMSVPSSMTFVEAACIPETWLTAYQLLHLVGKVQEGDNVLIHAGGSGVGTAAVQLCKMAKANAIVTAGSELKIETAIKLGAKVGINYKTDDFVTKVKEITDGKGANLILDCISGSYCEKNLAAIAFEGRWVIYGTMGGADASPNIFRLILGKRIKVEGTTLRARSIQYKSELVRQFSEVALPQFLSDEGLKPIVDSIFPFGKLGDAHRLMEENKNNGKIVILIQSEETPVSTID